MAGIRLGVAAGLLGLVGGVAMAAEPPNILGVEIGMSRDAALAQLDRDGGQWQKQDFQLTPKVLGTGARGKPFTYGTVLKRSRDGVNDEVSIVWSDPARPQQVVGIHRMYQKPDRFSASDMIDAYRAKFGKEGRESGGSGVPGRYLMWAYGANGKAVAPPSGAANKCWATWSDTREPVQHFQIIAAEWGRLSQIPAERASYLLRELGIDATCPRTMTVEILGGGGGDTANYFGADLVDHRQFVSMLDAVNAYMAREIAGAKAKDEEAVRKKGGVPSL